MKEGSLKKFMKLTKRKMDIWARFIEKIEKGEDPYQKSNLPYEERLTDILFFLENDEQKYKFIKCLMYIYKYNPFINKIPIEKLPPNLAQNIYSKQILVKHFYNVIISTLNKFVPITCVIPIENSNYNAILHGRIVLTEINNNVFGVYKIIKKIMYIQNLDFIIFGIKNGVVIKFNKNKDIKADFTIINNILAEQKIDTRLFNDEILIKNIGIDENVVVIIINLLLNHLILKSRW